MQYTKYISLFLFSFTTAYGQNSPKAVVKEIIANAYSVEKKSIDKQALFNDAASSIKLIDNGLKDTLNTARIDLYNTLGFVLNITQFASQRPKILSILIEGLKDESPEAVKNCITGLEQFKKNEFSRFDFVEIVGHLKSKQHAIGGIAKLIGFLGDSTNLKSLKDLSIDPYASPQDKQDISFASVRLGDSELIDKITKRLILKPINDDLVMYGLPDLLYTRQKPIYDLLVKEFSNAEKHCLSLNPNNTDKIKCGFLMLEKFIPYIENYPLKLDEYGDLDLADSQEAYDKALVDVQKWFEDNPNYTIKKEKF